MFLSVTEIELPKPLLPKPMENIDKFFTKKQQKNLDCLVNQLECEQKYKKVWGVNRSVTSVFILAQKVRKDYEEAYRDWYLRKKEAKEIRDSVIYSR